MRGKLVVGNWKMNGSLAANAGLTGALLDGLQSVRAGPERTIAVCVPFPYLGQIQAALTGSAIRWGAQDVSPHRSGAYTGQVGASMLVEFGVSLVLVGHSERRQLQGEEDELVAAKAAAALAAGVTPIVCVGETLAERDAGATPAVVLRQLDAAVAMLGDTLGRVVVAYEPVWAIGTGRTASPDQVQEVHALLRKRLRAANAGDVPILYGGSVKAANAKALFALADVDGGLVGGASLDAKEFLAIAAA